MRGTFLKRGERVSEIYQAIWSISDNLRGAVDGWDFKNYVLGAMFYRYIAPERFQESLETPNIEEILRKDFRDIESKTGCIGLFADFDVSSKKLGATSERRQERLKKLLHGVAIMKYENDALGDAYEYLMSMYASNAGKSGGEYFTPPEVSELLTRLGTVSKYEVKKVYDPSCGSGSLLLKALKVLGRDHVGGVYGQEINPTTYNLCRMNMLIHGVKFQIACEDTLIHPQLQEYAPYELIVSNPPYSVRWAGSDKSELKEDPRYAPAGTLAPKSKGDLAFVMHSLSCLSDDGMAVIVCFPGVMYRGGAEQAIRKYLVENNFVDSVIQLPENLFFGTSIATSILILKKQRTNKQILFIDASQEYEADTKRNHLKATNIDKIVSAYKERIEEAKFSSLVNIQDIGAEDYNLSVGRYVIPDESGSEIDISALNVKVRELTARHLEVSKEIDALIEELERSI